MNFATETATIRYVDGAVTPADLARVATDLGYPTRVKAGEGRGEEGGRADRKAAEITRLGWLDRDCGPSGAAGLRGGNG